MRSHAKESSAFTCGRKGFAALALIALTFAATLALSLTSPASATKFVANYLGNPTGTTGNTGGLFIEPRGVAVKESTGAVYVVDGNNNRIQQFDASNAFVRAWGQDVTGVNERQTVTVSATSGQYKLKFAGQTTANIAFNASAATVDNALDVLSSIAGDANVTVTGGTGDAGGTKPYVVTFTGTLAATDVEQLTSENGTTVLSGGSGVAIATAANGFGGTANTGFETCAVAAQCKAGLAAATGGAMSSPRGIALNQVTGSVYVTDGSNLRMQQFDASGNFIRIWGQDVVKTGAPNDLGTSAVEICDTTAGNVAADCKAGTSGTQGGAFASTFDGYPSVVPAGAPNAGNVLVADPANQRVQEFTSAGTFVRAFGLDVVQPGGTGEAFGPVLDERQAVALPPVFGFFQVNGGTFTLTFSGQTTAPIKWNASAIEVENELVALSNISPGDVSVSGAVKGPWTVAFSGALAGTNLPPMTGDPSQLSAESVGTGSATVEVTTPQEGGPSPAFEICTVGSQCKAGAPGNGSGQFGAGQPKQVIADATGAAYAVEGSPNARVQKFSGPSLTPSPFASGTLSASSSQEAPASLAYDSASGRVLVTAKRTLPPGTCTQDLAQSLIFELTTAGVLQDTHGSCTKIASGIAQGLAARGSSGLLYLAALGTWTDPFSISTLHRVWIFDNDGFDPALVDLNPPSEVTAHTARVSGTVTPNGPVGTPTSYRFQYSRNGVAWTDANTAVNIGDGSSPVAVGPLTITGLEAGTFYRVRLITSKGFGSPDAISPELTFATDGIVPEVQTLYPQSHADTTARLTANLNPSNLPTTYHFEYGRTPAYGNTAPVPDGSASGGATRLVSADVAGLEPDTTYHYRLVATNSEGSATGNDIAFKTYESGAAAKPARAYEMMTPPFKVVRSITGFGGGVGNNANPGLPSLDGDSMLWATAIFPLTDDVKAPAGGDRRLFSRTADGWVSRTLNTASAKGQSAGELVPGAAADKPKHFWQAISGDQKTLTLITENETLLQTEGYFGSTGYTYRAGTGTEGGYTSWIANTDTQGNASSELFRDSAALNDDGTALLRWGFYRGLGENPDTAGDDDPSDEQLAGGEAVYLVRSTDPDDLPSAPKELVNECTGTGVQATEILNRVGTGSASTDTIGARSCEEAPATPAATGTGTRSTGSATLTGVSIDTGSFSVGQIVSGVGIPRGATITAIGAGTLTISSPVVCGGAKGELAKITSGSPVLTRVRTLCGAFAVGQQITGPGIPVGATITAVDKYALTISANATASSGNAEVTATTATPTVLTANAQHVTSREGARGGGLGKTSIGSISDDGNRVFFLSPDVRSSEVVTNETLPTACAGGSGLDTSCPPQLFVRQYDSQGDPTVRWISRAQGVGTQQIGLIGSGAIFQGASRDGRYVYFQTNAPLLPTDPNAGSSITTGTAQNNSTDLYRYTLPQNLDDDPAGGTLLRVTGGPSGTADPGTNGVFSGGGLPLAGSLRYFSDDGKRAYFVTTAEIPGAINNPPSGGSTTPGGAVGNAQIRNLYLFDDTGASPTWRFIARIPFSTLGGSSENPPEALNSCASGPNNALAGGHMGMGAGQSRYIALGLSNCFRGTPDGRGVIFFTGGQLTADDRDDAGDIYLYDAEVDELTRVSAPQQPSAAPYGCIRTYHPVVYASCNADLGANPEGPGFSNLGVSGLDKIRGWGGGRYLNVAKGADGKIRVFFESESELLPGDTNGAHMDVYEWSNGRLSLVSPGNTSSYSFYSGNSVDGRDVFLFTSARIDPREIDDEDYDLYDVRIGGGFPYTPPATPCDVLAHQCRPGALPAAPSSSPASGSLSGAGNPKASKKKSCAKGKVQRKGRCVSKPSKGKKRASKQTGGASR